jgi:hypothetical protein
MQAYEHIIDAKVKTNPFDIVSASDFQTHRGQVVEAEMILEQPNISLYCLDHANRQALFVETPPTFDLLKEPFYFIAQYDAATRLIAVPYETLHALAKKVTVDPKRILLFYSTGRCGSTLFSHVLNLNPAIVSFSEPDVFSQLVMLRTSGQNDDAEITSLLYDSLLLMCANAQQQKFEHYAFKFRSYVLSVSDLLFQALPKAKIIFMYRNALTWARSFSRAFGSTDDNMTKRLEDANFRYMIPSVNKHLQTNPTISWVEYVAHMWVSSMQDMRWLQHHGAALVHARFEDLKKTPQSVIESLLMHCNLPMPSPEQLAQVLAKDSQEGTVGAKDSQEVVRHLTDADLEELGRIIHKLDPGLKPDTIL